MRYRSDIDGLRALAVIPVVLFHAELGPFAGGYVGVDVFFVISGFLITTIIKSEIDRDGFSIVRFYERRVRRILPAFFAMLAAVAVIGWFVSAPFDYRRFAASAIAATFFVSNILYWRQAENYFDVPLDTKPLLHTWSLAIEEQFYVVFPLALAGIAYLAARSRSRDRIVLGSIAACAAISFLVSVWATRQAPTAAFYLLPSRAWELLLGAGLACAPGLRPHRRWAGEAAGWTGILLIVAGALLYRPETPFPGTAALLPTLGAALVIFGGRGDLGTSAARTLSLGPVRFVGLISYSFYLWHWPLLVLTRQAVGQTAAWPWRAAAVVASLFIAALSWRYVERPFRKPGIALSRPMVFGLAGAAMAGCFIFGALTIAQQGFPSRFPGLSLADLDPETYRDPLWRKCHGAYSNRLTFADLCVRGAKGNAPTFALLGDSHAGSLAGGIFAAATKAGLAGYQLTEGSWRPFLSYYRVEREEMYRWMNGELAAILDDPAISLVIVTARWRSALGQTYAADGKVEPGSVVAPNALKSLAEQHPRKQFVLVSDTPDDPDFGLGAMASAKIAGRRFEPRVSAKKYAAIKHRVRRAFAALDGVPNIRWFEVPYTSCDANYCYGTRNGRTLYVDANHITADFAVEQADALLPIFAIGHAGDQAGGPPIETRP